MTGGKHFSKNLRPLNADGEVESMWAVSDKSYNQHDRCRH